MGAFNRDDTTTTYAGERVGGAAAVGSAKTSAAAAFALVFGLSSLVTGLLVFLSPLAVLFGLIGLVLGIVGIRKAGEPGVTGKGVAIGGLVLSVLGLLLGLLLLIGVAVFVDEEAVNELQQGIEDLRSEMSLPDVDIQGTDIQVQEN